MDNQFKPDFGSKYYVLAPTNYKASYTISLPSLELKTFNEKAKTFEGNDSVKTTSEEWKKVVEESIEYYTVGNLYRDRVTEEQSNFKEGVEKDGELLSIQSLKFKKLEGELKGEAALLKVSKLLGLGDVFSVPLPHSGLWVTIKPPTEKDLIDFYNSLFREKIMLGRATSGLTLTNFSVYINQKLFEFMLRHIHSINNSDITKENLKNYLLIYDLPILAWGFACTMYPNGFDFKRACINDISECSYVASGLINPIKLLWIDNSALTDIQKNFLYEYRPNKLNLEAYEKYQAEHARVAKRVFTTQSGIKVHLKVPTVAEHTSDGIAWINQVNSAIDRALTEEDGDDARIELLNQYVKSSVLRIYSHFIDYIELDDSIIQDRETIDTVLEALSSDDQTREEITKEILKYKSDSILALIGIPEYDCPQCGFNQNPEPVNTHFNSIIPLDVINLFFTLITLRIAKVIERE